MDSSKTNSTYFPAWMGRNPRDSAQWQVSEDQHLIELFRCGSSLDHLVAIHGRPEHAIESRLLKLISTNYAKREQAKQEALKGFVTYPFNLEEAQDGRQIEAWMKSHWVKCDFVEQKPNSEMVVVTLKGYTYNVLPTNVRMVRKKAYILLEIANNFVYFLKNKDELEECINKVERHSSYTIKEVDLD